MNTKQIREHISAIKRASHSKAYTNFYEYNNESEYSVLLDSHTIVFSCYSKYAMRTFFFSSDLQQLEKLLAMQQRESVLDYLGDCDDSLLEVFENSGYRRFARFLRLSNKELVNVFNPANNPYGEYLERFADEKKVIVASLQDLNELYEKLLGVFDCRTSHFDSREQVADCIKKGHVLLYKENGKIVSFIIFVCSGKKFYGNHIYNGAQNHIAMSLYAKAAKIAIEAGCTYGYSWVEETNTASLRFGQLKQYFPDGMTDTIFIKED
ncbi:MAG: hypothetical protein J1F02_05145 [Lachnospiraceae bacterium]|nr:hypothetical protein [Lachnospiraceae bacterium]